MAWISAERRSKAATRSVCRAERCIKNRMPRRGPAPAGGGFRFRVCATSSISTAFLMVSRKMSSASLPSWKSTNGALSVTDAYCPVTRPEAVRRRGAGLACNRPALPSSAAPPLMVAVLVTLIRSGCPRRSVRPDRSSPPPAYRGHDVIVPIELPARWRCSPHAAAGDDRPAPPRVPAEATVTVGVVSAPLTCR